MVMKSQSLWLIKKNKPQILSKAINYKKNDKTVLIKTIFSGISKGTENLVAKGMVDKKQYNIMKSPFQEGSFSFPVKYGYINVGEIIDGPSKLIGKKAFSLSPHQTYFIINIKSLNFLKNSNLQKYLLTANMETAINIFWDSHSKKNNKILIIGLGSVGLLTAYFFKLKGFKKINVTDINEEKKKIAKTLGLNFVNFNKINNCDCIINTTSNYEVLNTSMNKLNIEGKIIEASWYGSKKGELNLGNDFHSKRLKIISSQVSNIPLHMQKKYNFKSRLKIAIDALNNNKVLHLINSSSKFMNLEKDYISILNDPNIIMHLVEY